MSQVLPTKSESAALNHLNTKHENSPATGAKLDPQNVSRSRSKSKAREKSVRHYFLPIQATKDEKILKKSKQKKGMFTVKWKKGLGALNISSEDEKSPG